MSVDLQAVMWKAIWLHSNILKILGMTTLLSGTSNVSVVIICVGTLQKEAMALFSPAIGILLRFAINGIIKLVTVDGEALGIG